MESPIYVCVENVVATGKVDCKIPFNKLVKIGKIHKTRGFPAVVLRLKRPRASILVFSNGRLVCSGAKGEKEAYQALRKTVNLIGIKPRRFEVKIENIVASSRIGLEYSIDLLAKKLPQSIYEPNYFPGLIYKMKNPKTIVLIFPKGRIVLTGLKTEKEIADAVENLKQTFSMLNTSLF